MSGFHSRGLVYQGARDYIEKYVPGGCAAVRGNLRPETATFWDQLFLAGTLFDALPIVEISRAAAEVAQQPHEEFIRANAQWLAQRDIRGVYRAILHVLSPSLVAVRLPRVALRYFDFGDASATMSSDGVCQAEQRGLPQPMASWFTACVEGFVPKALGMAGARNPRVKPVRVMRDGEMHGMVTVTVSYEFTWENDPNRSGRLAGPESSR
jgi:hypothetical protein